MFWEIITKAFGFTGINDATVWQDVLISTILIPIGLIIANWLLSLWNRIRPSKSLFNGFLNKASLVLIFHSQMSGADNNWNFNPEQKYITRYPNPLPTDKNNLAVQRKLRIDPILSQSESDCLSDVYNVLGRCGKVENIVSADLIRDWGKWSNSIISVGFNPKTMKLMGKCSPIYFELVTVGESMEIKSIDNKVSYDAFLPNDAGIIQKTFIKNTRVPVFILAGLGTLGTEATGYILNKHLVELGKLYGSSTFCAFLKVLTNEGKESAYIDKVYPFPNWYRRLLYPITYLKFKKTCL